jgi:hypothetical protein
LNGLFVGLFAFALTCPAAAPKADPRFAFRTEFTNAHLPWYQPKPLEFPPLHSEQQAKRAEAAKR